MTDRPRLVVAVYGLINAGKSSLINVLAGTDDRPTGPIGGTTRDVAEVGWRSIDADLGAFDVRLLDTPGLEEVGDDGRSSLATEAARSADLVLFVAAEDLTATALRAVRALHEVGKPIVLALNKVDLLSRTEEESILERVRDRLRGIVDREEIVAIAAAPIVRERSGSKVETRRGEPRVDALVARLVAAVTESGEDLRALNEARARIEAHAAEREKIRAERRVRAERASDETAGALALALAVNPIPLIDFLTGPAGLAVLISRVSAVYDEYPSAQAIRGLSAELFKGGRVALWGSTAAVLAGGAMKLVPGLGHLAGALTQGAAAGYLAHILGRALVDYFDNGHDWGDGGLIAALDRIAARTDRKALTAGLVEQLKSRLRERRRGGT
jgi:small GTP-binding protein